MAKENRPPQARQIALYSAGGAFGGTLLAMLLFWLLTNGFCCDNDRVALQKPATSINAVGAAVAVPRYA